jgi:uncharacterized protein YjiS (DUF1127 family)
MGGKGRCEVENEAFRKWWFEYGSGITPSYGQDMHEHAHTIAAEAWQAAISYQRERESIAALRREGE